MTGVQTCALPIYVATLSGIRAIGVHWCPLSLKFLICFVVVALIDFHIRQDFIRTTVGWKKKKTHNGGKDKQNDLLEWHKWSHMEKQDEKSPICDEIASAGVYYN